MMLMAGGLLNAGEGMRYYLQKKLTLLCGHHKVFFALPSETILKEIEVPLKRDKMSLLGVNPVYNRGII